MREQRRGRAIAMTADEVDAYLRTARTCRVGSVGADGAPHVSALWFVWDGTALWLNSLTKSQRWTNVVRSPRVSVLVDGGDEFLELHGVEIIGEAEVVGDVPRTEAANPAAGRARAAVRRQVRRRPVRARWASRAGCVSSPTRS